MQAAISYRHNIMSVNSIDTFVSIRGGFNQNTRDVYFVRALGADGGIREKIQAIDKKMDQQSREHRVFYKRISEFAMPGQEELNYYTNAYEAWWEKNTIVPMGKSDNALLNSALGEAVRKTIPLFRKTKPNVSDTIIKNFVVKALCWIDGMLAPFWKEWTERSNIKIIADNVTKVQEYLTLYMMTLLGCDVLLWQTEADVECGSELKSLSAELHLGPYQPGKLPRYVESPIETQPEEKKVSVSRVKVNAKKPDSAKRNTALYRQDTGREKSIEELALLASSIVMITVHDVHGEPIAGGSGIMIGRDGYILTNNHVARGGRFYSVCIEGDEEVYHTDEVIKYHSVLDLALLRIQRTLTPLKLYDGHKELSRGQKVVAIGSPLGLFNSVSDGIISGFRKIDSVDMIQFTAPISHGSSGGAVLNMQGDLIGISTAGFDQGQNINLAVGYESIRMFTKGF